jgi:hypothetical protein
VYQQQEEEQQQQAQEQDAENPFLDPPFLRIKMILEILSRFSQIDSCLLVTLTSRLGGNGSESIG